MLDYDKNIATVNHMTKSKVLIAKSKRGVDDNGIKNIYFEKLDANLNRKITTANHMTNLKELHTYGFCGIDNNGIKNINLEILDASSNQKITDEKHMTDLKELWMNKNHGTLPINAKKSKRYYHQLMRT